MAYLDDIPKYAFGTDYELGDDPSNQITEIELKQFILDAIKLGCRHFDCAPLYRTQHVVGAALKEAMNMVPRQKFFITSKLSPNMMRTENVLRNVETTLQDLKLTYLDLFLIHAPFATKHVSDDEVYPLDGEGNLLLDEEEGLLEKAWLKLVDLKKKGYTRYIGVSNINLEQLIRLNKLHHIDVVQNEYHMYNQNREIFDYCEEIDVHFEAYAAFGSPARALKHNKPCVMLDPLVNQVARQHNLTIPEVIIQWIHQQPLSYVIKCDNLAQLEENLKAANCTAVSVNDMIDLDSQDRQTRLYFYDEYKGIRRHREYPFNSTKEHKEPLGEHKEPLGEHNEPRADESSPKDSTTMGQKHQTSPATSIVKVETTENEEALTDST